MTDTVEIHIPLEQIFTKKISKTVFEIIGDVSDYGVYFGTRGGRKENGKHILVDLYHVQESIPTSHTGIGFKFMHKANNCLPHVILNCSVAKILQGHNVFGETDILQGVCEMLGIFKESFPELYSYLDVQNAEIARFDVTLPMNCGSRKLAEKAREYIRHIDVSRLKNLSISKKKQHFNTIYFGSENSKVGGFKVYCKGVELDNVLDDLHSKAEKGCIASLSKLKPYTKEVIDFADGSIRVEATVKKRMLKEQGIPTNLWQFLAYQINNPLIYKSLFKYKTDVFFDSLRSIKLKYSNDESVYKLLHDKLTTITKTGKTSTTKARNAYRFYRSLRFDGFYEVKRTTPIRTFQMNLKLLVDCGLSKAFLQNFDGENEEKPLLTFIKIDYDKPNPKSYQKPISEYVPEFYEFFKKVA